MILTKKLARIVPKKKKYVVSEAEMVVVQSQPS